MVNALVRNPRLMLLMIALILVVGLGALNQLARTEDPHITNRFAAVITAYPGASAERVELLVTEVLESRLRQLDELSLITSNSRPGISAITLELKDNVFETDPVWSRARDLLADAVVDLPAGAARPNLDDQLGYAFTRIFSLRWQGPGEPDLTVLGRYGEALASRLRVLAGTDFVKVQGRPQEEILVRVDDNQMQALGLTTDALASLIASADAKGSAGTLESATVRAQVEVAGELDSLNRIRQIPLRLGQDLAGIRVGDIAMVERSQLEPGDDRAIVQGDPAVLVAVRMLPDVRVDRWDDQVEAQLAALQSQLPSNVHLETLFSQRDYTETRLSELLTNLGQGFAIILVVLLVTLGLRSALLVATALPLTALITLACMQFYGLPIHQMSVTGLVVALGIMVDNAIVIVDAIAQRRGQGMGPVEAVRQTLRHFWLPLLASTLTTVLAFAPIWLMPGPAGEFVGGIALSVSFALLTSYVLSHTLIAGLGGRFIPPRSDGAWWQQGLTIAPLARGLERSLALALKRPILAMLAMTLLPLAGFFAAGQMTEQFFPPSDRDMFQIEVRLGEAASLPATQARVAELDAYLRQQPGITQTVWSIGRNAPSFYYNLLQREQGVPRYAQGMISTDGFERANALIESLQRELGPRFPDMQILVRKLEQGPPFNAPVEFRLYGPDLAELDRIGEQLRAVLQQQPEVTHTRAALGSGLPRIKLALDEPAVTAAGLTLADVTTQIRGNLDGSLGGTVQEGPESIPVRVRLNSDVRRQSSDLGNLQLTTADGQILPLSALGERTVIASRSQIPHRNGERLNTIEAFIVAGVLPAQVLNRTLAQLESEGLALPEGYRLEVGGESAERNEAVGKLMSSVAIISVLLVAIVVLSFNSFRLTAVILASAFQSVGLGLLSVYLAGYAFGFNVIIALMGLMGLAINAAIVILAELEDSPEARAGEVGPMIRAVTSCGRHIGSTTITTIGGFMPLILAGGGFWPPFAIAIAGGTALTTLLSFIFVPAAYRVVRRWRSPIARPEPIAIAA
ncbi:efflux RND transporter permease subunit [Ferrimonas balearica]|uniref:efflux RND transporter permease subunit n=1 Tax=Ferrimonas balearica TaxID=44012 RepID=UPI001C9A0F9D|nr:efflux RND transporter permease subunit [Ferrimonas balearica]MBY5922059.1 efflux RND transporter permease subunit [Ferrimonas balearica]MBY5994601.1 efflux RND transporter permease subunit [Ferrimonas balearica]